MQSTQRTHPVREKMYRQAFEQFTESQAFDWKERWPDGPFLALYQDTVYQIESRYDLNERARLMLTCTDEAVHMPLAVWVEMARGVHHEAQFYVRLLNRLTTPEERKHLQLAFAISRTTSRPAESFWSALYHLNEAGLYPKAIVTAAQVGDVDAMTRQLEAELVRNGKSFLNQVPNGIFETLVVNESADMTIPFYVFTVDPAAWAIDVLV